MQLDVSGGSVADEWSVTYTGPGSPSGTTWTGTGWTSANGLIIITESHVYNVGGTYDVEFSYEVFAQGVSRITGTYAATAGGLGPSYIDMLAIPWEISGACSASTAGLPSYMDDDLYAYNSNCTGTATGGRRFKYKDESGWTELPVTLAPGSPPAIGGGCDDPGVGSVSASNQNSMSIGSYAENSGSNVVYDTGIITACTELVYCDGILIDTVTSGGQSVPWTQYQKEHQTISRGGSVRGIPDLEKKIQRFNNDFRLLLWRSEMPQTKAGLFSECDYTVGAVNTNTTSSTTPEVHPHQAEILQEVQFAVAAVEDTLSYNSYSPWSSSGVLEGTRSWSFFPDEPVICPGVGIYPECDEGELTTVQVLEGGPTDYPEAESYSATRSYIFPSDVGLTADMVGYQGHDEALARYFNSWCNPHWSYGVWTEPSLGWEVDGSPETWAAYWQKVGSQYIFNTGASITTKIRNHLWSEPLENDGNGAFLDSAFGELRWPGVSRFDVRAFVPRSSLVYGEDQESLMSASEGTLSVSGTTITVTPP